MVKQELDFLDVVTGEKFVTKEYVIKNVKTKRGMRKVAVATSPSGNKATRFVSKNFLGS